MSLRGLCTVAHLTCTCNSYLPHSILSCKLLATKLASALTRHRCRHIRLTQTASLKSTSQQQQCIPKDEHYVTGWHSLPTTILLWHKDPNLIQLEPPVSTQSTHMIACLLACQHPIYPADNDKSYDLANMIKVENHTGMSVG